MVYSIIKPYSIADSMTYRILDWKYITSHLSWDTPTWRQRRSFGLHFSIQDDVSHGLRTPREEIAFTARSKIQSQSQIFRYGRSIFCLPHWTNFSDIFYLCLHWVSVVRGLKYLIWNSETLVYFKLSNSSQLDFFF
jgi:hypothetical protein